MAKRKKDGDSSKELLTRIRDRFKVMHEADSENRREALSDMKFVNVPGEQWDSDMKKRRNKRPCYEFNKLRVTCKRVINDIRANRPMGKVRAVENGDKSTAEILEGLIRNVWGNSDGDTVIDQAAEYQVTGGMGAWRVTTKYSSEDAFEQDVAVESIANPYCLYADPSCHDYMKRDARDFILTDRIAKATYKQRWPNKAAVDWDSQEFDDDEEWQDDETVRIVEYWWKEPYQKEIWQLADGKVVDPESDEGEAIEAALEQGLMPPDFIRQKRTVTCHKVRMCIASGEAILEGPTDWAGAHLPFIIIYGESMVIDGKHLWWGLPRFAKDAQRSYNISRTAIAETIAMTPQAKFWATVEQAKGHEARWRVAHDENIPFQLYNADPKAPGVPQRMGGSDVPVALIQESQIASEEIKAVTGIFDASLGNRGNETSGRAIQARQQQGEIATYNFQDNLAKGIRRTWEILVDLIPRVYDTERDLRIIGSDGAEDYAKVNQMVQDPATGQVIKVNDLSTGKYDVTITVGPSWSTKRQEAADIYMQLTQANPALFPVVGDLMMKSMDLPYSEDMAERLQAMLPPQIQALQNKDSKQSPEVMQAMAQADQAMQQVQQMAQQMQQDAQGLQQEKAAVDKAKSDLQVQAAQMEADYQRMVADITKRQAAIEVKLAQAASDQERQAAEAEKSQVQSEANQAVQAIQAQADDFMRKAYKILVNEPEPLT